MNLCCVLVLPFSVLEVNLYVILRNVPRSEVFLMSVTALSIRIMSANLT
jgi:hypothetical protein